MQGLDHTFCCVFEPIAQVIVEVPNLLDFLVIALSILLKELVEGKKMMGVKSPCVKEPDRKRPGNAAVPVSKGMDGDKAVMGGSSYYDGMQGLRYLIP